MRGVRGADEGSNQYTATAMLAPSDHENLQIDLVANNPGRHELTAIVDYFFEDNPDDTGRHTETINVEAATTESDNNDDPPIPVVLGLGQMMTM